jgi:uncharacterized membrane protein YccC
VRAAVTIAIAASLYRSLPQQNGYWIPVTALIVLRPDLHQTLTRGVARLAGTVTGAAVGTALVLLLPSLPSLPPLHGLRSELELLASSQWILAGGIVLFAGASYALFQVNYAYYAFFLTGYVVFLLSLAGVGAESLIVHRAVFTAVGGALPLATYWSLVAGEKMRHRNWPVFSSSDA